jgi:hypothetical protein
MSTFTKQQARERLEAEGIAFSHADYMAGRVTFREYYEQFITPAVTHLVLWGIGRQAILASTDEHFNDIPLNKWDLLRGVSFRGSELVGKVSFPNAFLVGLSNISSYADGMSYHPSVSPSDGVCLLKAAARKIKMDAQGHVIRWESGELLVCSCGNTTDTDGFVCVDENRLECEPVEGEWSGRYMCQSCGATITLPDMGNGAAQ